MPFYSSRSINANDVINNFIKSVISEKRREKYLSKDKNQDFNSSSNVSTVSDDDRKTNTSTSNNDKKNNDDNYNLNTLIKKEMRKMTNYFNKNDVYVTEPSLACQYYCNLTNDDGDERLISYQKNNLEYFVKAYKRLAKRRYK